MAKTLRALVVEDSEDDAELMIQEIRGSGYDPIFKRVETAEDMVIALSEKWDVVLADYSLPNFSATRALEILKEKDIDIPFIIVSGTIGENTAVAAMKAGAHDYLMKDNLTRLVAAIEREIRDAKIRRDRKKAQEALKESEERFKQVAESAGEWIWEVDVDGLYTYASPVVEKILGYKPKEIVGKKYFYELFHPEDREELKEKAFRVFSKKQRFREFISRNIHKNYELIWLSRTGTPILDENGNLLGYRGADKDITERKKAEDQIRRSLKEKDVLLKEIHHRVKNNMQVISSLINLQARNIKDKGVLDVFKETQNRIRSMALIHERLYRSEDLASIDFGDYVSGITGYLFSSYGINSEVIKRKVDIKGISLDINKAIPCGLIVNELVTNSLRHAFPDARKGEIYVGIYKSDDKKFTLTVSDNGVGLPENFDIKKVDTLGLQLVLTLVEQLGGTLKLDTSGGTKFDIEFLIDAKAG